MSLWESYIHGHCWSYAKEGQDPTPKWPRGLFGVVGNITHSAIKLGQNVVITSGGNDATDNI